MSGMKRVLFVENRYRTLFWIEMAKLLEKEGHEVFFVVENHLFKPSHQNVYVIPYPRQRDLVVSESHPEFAEIKRSDRALNYFGLSSEDHYLYYYTQLKRIVEKVNPDIVFGESTAFHELLLIEICKQKEIPYLHPSSCRYPIGRFSFYKYDTLKPYGGSDEILEDEKALEVIHRIICRKVIPDYMRKKKISFSARYSRLRELLKLSFAYYTGERYDTPSPSIKYKIEKSRKRNIDRWDLIAGRSEVLMEERKFKILYPLQMQPEASLDVWGRKHNDQLKVIESILAATDRNVIVVVKPNPKSKYELTEKLIDFLESNERVVMIPHKKTMGEVFPGIDLVITVTGTIAMECIWSDKPVVTLANTLYNKVRSAVYLKKFDQLPRIVDEVKTDGFPQIGNKEKIEFINLINRTSFEGMPYERNLDINNLQKCKAAFESVLNSF